MELKKRLETFKMERKENEAFRMEVRKRTRAEERRVFEKEALRVASERAKERANKPTFGRKIESIAKTAYKISAPRRRTAVNYRQGKYKPFRIDSLI
jgi:hypothetical protein